MVWALSLALVPLFRCSAVCKMGLLQPIGLGDVPACLQTAKHSAVGERKPVDRQLQSCPCPAVAKWNWHLGLCWETRGRELIKDQFLIFCFGGNAEQQQKCWSC